MIFENETVKAFLDIHPNAPGHTLIVSKHHSTHVFEMCADDLRAVMDAARLVCRAAERSLGASGCRLQFNVGEHAGQTVLHTHLHMIPAYLPGGPSDLPIELAAIAERLRS